ncbi:MAG: hypothetical protein IKD70_04165, partial [Eggerthellaceae bacterium]|nr:hypothetical protein [Eggerthellaceae bacterium]
AMPASKTYEELRRGAVEASLGIEHEPEVEFDEEPDAYGEFSDADDAAQEATADGEGPGDAAPGTGSDIGAGGATEPEPEPESAPAPEEDAPAYLPQLLPDDDDGEYAAFTDDAADGAAGDAFSPEGPARPSVGSGARVIAADFPRRRSPAKTFFAVLFFLVLAALLVLTGFLSRERWYMHDDAFDIQGTWIIRGDAARGHDEATITITDSKIILDKDTTYGYTLDTRSKIITYTFQDLQGTGHYRFSADRKWLIIEDGNFNWFITCAEDFSWQLRSWWATLTQTSQPPLEPAEDAALLRRA